MKKIFIALLFLITLAGCNNFAGEAKSIKLSYKLDANKEAIRLNVEFLNYDSSSFVYGIIYKQQTNYEETLGLSFEDDVIIKKGKINEAGVFSTLITDIPLKDYDRPLVFRAFIENSKGKLVTYSNQIETFLPYDLALVSSSSFGREIIREVNKKAAVYENIELTATINEEKQGFIIEVNYEEYQEKDRYLLGIIYKVNAFDEDKENFYIGVPDINYFYYGKLTDDKLLIEFFKIGKSRYLEEITFKAIVKDLSEDKTIYSSETKTVSLYSLATEAESEFAENVVNYVNNSYVDVNEIIIKTDENGEYRIESYSKGITVEMIYVGFLNVKLIVTLKNNHKFSSDFVKENITVTIDGETVKQFTLSLSVKGLVITYDDPYWTVPY